MTCIMIEFNKRKSAAVINDFARITAAAMERPIGRRPAELIRFVTDRGASATRGVANFRPSYGRAGDVEDVLKVGRAVVRRNAILERESVLLAAIASAFREVGRVVTETVGTGRGTIAAISDGHLIIARRLFNVRENERDPRGVIPVARADRKVTVSSVDVHMRRKTKLLEVVGALHTTSRFARRLNCRKKKTD